MATSASKISDVLMEERKDLGKRRAVIGKPYTTTDNRSDLDENLTGLAMSGGGVRAAAFSLGFLQSLYANGRMKLVDYLSTVSGGGYAGALFSSEIARFNGEINWNGHEKGSGHQSLSIMPNEDGSQPERVEELALHGRKMGNIIRMLSRHLFGFLGINLFVLSGVVFIAAILAYIMKLGWNPEWYPYMAELGFESDLSIPFFPAFVAFWIWLALQITGRVSKAKGKPPSPMTQNGYLLLIATFVLGVVTFFAVGDIDIGFLVDQFDVSIRIESLLNRVVRYAGAVASGVFAAAMLPYLVPTKLLESGRQDRGTPQNALFHIVGCLIVLGVLFSFTTSLLTKTSQTPQQAATKSVRILLLPIYRWIVGFPN